MPELLAADIPRSMTLAEFERQKATLRCVRCGHLGLEPGPPEVQNNGIPIVCPSCHKKHALGGRTLWLKQTTKKNRKDYPAGQSIAEVWERYKHRCVVCTLPHAALVDIRIGISNHHVAERYDPTEYDCPIVPVCQACKAIVDARQKEAWRWYRRLLEIKGESDAGGGAVLSAPRLPRNPLSPARETPVGALEGRPDDDADV